MTLPSGQVLQQRYRIVSLLGQGGMGAVYQARDTRLNVSVALKEMTPQAGLDPHTLAQLHDQFQQEATVLARLQHPNLVRVTDFFEEGGRAYLAMGLVEGESLARRIAREGRLPEAQVRLWADQLLDALAYCHAQGVVHRDLKPQNVIIRPDGQAVLVDFGLVKLWDPRDPHTRTAMRGMGTPEYAPPEQYGGTMSHTDARSDIYGLGATLYHALAGQAPPTATQRVVTPGALVPLLVANPQVSPHMEAVLGQALELRPEARWPSAAAMKGALRGLPARSAGPPRTPPPPPSGRGEAGAGAPAGRRRSIWLIVASILGVAALSVIVIGLVLAATWLFNQRTGRLGAETPSRTATPTGGRLTPTATLLPSREPTTAAPGEATTLSPTPTRAPSDTATAASTLPALTSTPTRTRTPTLAPTATATPTPTPSPTPGCPEVSGPFAAVWQDVGTRVGCSLNAAHSIWLAQEGFERGVMLWRKDTDAVYVLYETNAWASYANTWHEGDPDYSCPESAPEESPPTPLRGFGKVWCSHEEVRNGLGWASDPERGYSTEAQDFEHGWILRTDSGWTLVAYDDGTWEIR